MSDDEQELDHSVRVGIALVRDEIDTSGVELGDLIIQAYSDGDAYAIHRDGELVGAADHDAFSSASAWIHFLDRHSTQDLSGRLPLPDLTPDTTPEVGIE